MIFTWVDFLTGFFLMNAMPHMLFALIRLRFLSLFGFSAVGNLIYAGVNVIIALALYHYEHGLSSLLHDGIFIGALAVLLTYLITGRFMVALFQEKRA